MKPLPLHPGQGIVDVFTSMCLPPPVVDGRSWLLSRESHGFRMILLIFRSLMPVQSANMVLRRVLLSISWDQIYTKSLCFEGTINERNCKEKVGTLRCVILPLE
jgi:hypothetical protein